MKRALLVGINYRGTDSELQGCINDVDHVNKILSKAGYKCTILTDDTSDKPTRLNIMKELALMIFSGATEMVFHYSGHGSQIADWSGDEVDGQDECLVPIDYKKWGMITDDHLRAIFSLVPENSKLFVLLDSCHSGTCMDLKYNLWSRPGELKLIADKEYTDTRCDIYMISGSQDAQTSADTVEDKQHQGALTWAFCKVYQIDTILTWRQLIVGIRDLLKASKYEQLPNFSTGKKINLDSKIYLKK